MIEHQETDGALLQRLGMDGTLWAQEFRQIAITLGYSDMDEGWLIGWFANAIMAGYDEALRKAAKADNQQGDDTILDKLDTLVGEAYQLAGWALADIPTHPFPDSEAEKLLNLLSADIPDLLESLHKHQPTAPDMGASSVWGLSDRKSVV